MKSPKRLGAAERRQQLLSVAAKLLTKHGVDGLQFTLFSEAAGVSRPVLYKFFPTRNALLKAVLEDFEQELTRQFFAVASERIPGTLEEVTRLFIDAICDSIEVKGAGAWHLLDAKGPDAEVAALGRAIQARLMRPWYAYIKEATQASSREVATVSLMLVAAGRAVLELWYGGKLSRDEAARDATRGVSALLAAFTVKTGETRATRAKRRATTKKTARTSSR